LDPIKARQLQMDERHAAIDAPQVQIDVNVLQIVKITGSYTQEKQPPDIAG